MEIKVTDDIARLARNIAYTTNLSFLEAHIAATITAGVIRKGTSPTAAVAIYRDVLAALQSTGGALPGD